MTDQTQPTLADNPGLEATKPADNPNDKPLPELTPEEIAEAKKAGVVEAVKEAAKTGFLAGAPNDYGASIYDPNSARFAGSRDVFMLHDWLDLEPDALAERIAGDGEHPLSEAKIAALIEVERSGKNRTDIVKVLCDRLGLKSPTEVTAAGPAYTNDTTAVTKL